MEEIYTQKFVGDFLQTNWATINEPIVFQVAI